MITLTPPIRAAPSKAHNNTRFTFLTFGGFMNTRTFFRWFLSGGVLLIAASVLAFGQSTPPTTTPTQGTTLNLPFKIGLSIGYRWYIGHDDVVPTYTISPNDSTVQRNKDSDWSDVVLSGTIAVFPLNFAKPADGSEQYWNRIGFIANVDIASFSIDKAKALSTPLSIEGGIGLAYKITDYFALAASLYCKRIITTYFQEKW